MAAFRFKLQPVLEQREREERARRIELAAIEGERGEAEAIIRGAQVAIEAFREEWRATATRGVLRPGDIGRQASASIAQHVKAQQAAIRLAGIMERLDEARGRLAQASARRRAVELLRQRRLAEWEREQAHREASAVDDLVTGAAARRLMRGGS
ncbi:MAG: flagellar export protein FliJ [Planctomycetota bacterium]